MAFNEIWSSNKQTEWNKLFKKYWSLIKEDNIQIEYDLNRLSVDLLSVMNEEQWFNFLFEKYFVWKYTAKNRLATTRKNLKKYLNEERLGELHQIKNDILRIDVTNIKNSLSTACEIKGLGVAGASGLLSLIYPKEFATVDQFVVKALLEVDEKKEIVENMNPEGLSLNDGVILTDIMRNKSKKMNELFQTDFWTPRTVEMALWAYRG